MGREIRMVPPNWEHPREKNRYNGEEQYRPLFEESYEEERRKWIDGFLSWNSKTHPHYKPDLDWWEWHGSPPERDMHADYGGSETTWFQLYETVSEGTPVTPPFATREELIEYLVSNGDFWDQRRCRDGRQPGPPGWSSESATRMVSSGFAPSMVVTGNVLHEPRDMTPGVI